MSTELFDLALKASQQERDQIVQQAVDETLHEVECSLAASEAERIAVEFERLIATARDASALKRVEQDIDQALARLDGLKFKAREWRALLNKGR